MTSLKKPSTILALIFLPFLALFITKSFITMNNVPFHDFDEAHRAENAKRMKEYKSYFVPLTGSLFEQNDHLKTPLKENPNLYLYYHLERPPLIYDLMIISTTLLGESEWVYRLPSFLLGLSTMLAFLVFARLESKNINALFIGLLSIITAGDLWLSSQYAQMDTGITFFLFLSLLSLILYLTKKREILIYLAGIFLGLGFLSKLQPAIIFSFPILFLVISKKLTIKDLLKFIAGFLAVFAPWILYLISRFGIQDSIHTITGFAITSASIFDEHYMAPFFWYIRWFWEAFRPGWTIFLTFLFYDLLTFNLNWKKLTLLSYIIFGLLAFSIPVNKLWWYVLPLAPAIAYYVFLSANDLLKNNPKKLINISFIIIISSLPIFLGVKNIEAVTYGAFLIFVSYKIILSSRITNLIKSKNIQLLFYIAIIISLSSFVFRFPKIIPYHWNTKPVALFYKNIPGEKCLWLGDMPGEAALFYSNAGEIMPIQRKPHTLVFSRCDQNFLITPDDYGEGELIIRKGSIRLYKLNK